MKYELLSLVKLSTYRRITANEQLRYPIIYNCCSSIYLLKVSAFLCPKLIIFVLCLVTWHTYLHVCFHIKLQCVRWVSVQIMTHYTSNYLGLVSSGDSYKVARFHRAAFWYKQYTPWRPSYAQLLSGKRDILCSAVSFIDLFWKQQRCFRFHGNQLNISSPRYISHHRALNVSD